ncbi:MAG: hypothetical protein ABI664_14475 [bacterium]
MIGLLVVAQLLVVAHGPDTAATCAPMEISVAARVPGLIAPRIVPASLGSSLQLLKTSLSNRLERDGAGQPTALTEVTFVVATDGVGKVVLPQFVATVGTQRATATPMPVDVHPGEAIPPMVIVRAWLDRSGQGATADTLYVGQQVDYVVDVQLNESARQRLRRNPTFFPPEMPGVLAYDLAPPAALTRVGRHCFETLSYRRALFPLFAGRTAIAPAALTYSLPLSTSFFSREESFELRTDSVRFIALDVPVADRPADFAGAVGELGATSRLSTERARMGDPVVLTLRLEGTGNVKLWPRPSIALGWASVAEGEERVVVDTSHARVRGSKEFDWLLTPKQSGHQEVPKIDYQYFDAERGKYAEASAPPLSLDVASASLAAVDSTPVTRLGIRRSLRAETPPPIASRSWYWVLLVIAPVPAAFRRARGKARVRTERRSALRRIRQSASREERLTARELRKLYLEAVGERVAGTIGVTQREVFARALRRSGVTAETADMAGAFLERLDAAAFSPAGRISADAIGEASKIASAVDAEAVRKVVTPTVVHAFVGAMMIVGAASAAFALPRGVADTFSRGVEAYDHSAFTTSQHLFARVVTRAPRAVDAWANLGTAAWSRGDSAAAVRGWQRALRLDPLDGDVRDRLDAVQPPLLRAPGYVAPLPADAVAFAALACWIGAWMMLIVPPARRPRNARSIAGGAIALGVVLLLGALEMEDRVSPSGLAVMRTTRVLLEAPGSQSAAASGNVGETGRIGAREGSWVRIALDGSRAGWVPSSSVLLMDGVPIED